MLIGIDPLLGPALLAHLCAMGHGDELVIADGNFPADSVAKRLVRMDGTSATQMLSAVLSVLPLDAYADAAVCVMKVVDGGDTPAPIIDEFRAIVSSLSGETFAGIVGIERFAFYDRARQAYAVIATGEQRVYGNVLLRKGVIQI